MNHLTRFIINEVNVRGQIIQLSSAWQQLLKPHDYPEKLSGFLGELTAATLMLASGLKIDGKLLAQIQSTGDLSLMVSEATLSQKENLTLNPIQLRAYARSKHDGVLDTPWPLLMPEARLTFTIWNQQERYQSITSAADRSLSHALESYFLQSEQAETFIRLFGTPTHVSGLFLQHIPDKPFNEEDWRYVSEIANTISAKELNELEPTIILHRLFHDLDVQRYDPQPIAWNDQVNQANMVQAICSIPQAELDELMEQQSQTLIIKCEFTGQTLVFDTAMIADIRQKGIMPA